MARKKICMDCVHCEVFPTDNPKAACRKLGKLLNPKNPAPKRCASKVKSKGR